VGVGDSLEAAIELRAPVPAGQWHLILDGIIIEPVTARFEILWRAAGGGDVTLIDVEHAFEPHPDGGYTAVPFETTIEAPAAAAATGDQLVFRYSAPDATASVAYIPNGDGELTGGRIPSIDLP
jgi:hypothetical protein